MHLTMSSPYVLTPLLACLLSFGLAVGQDGRNVTNIIGVSSADGKSHVTKELLEECIEALPKPGDLAADVKSKTQFLKEINGEKTKNDHVKSYQATIEINYMLFQKELIIITTNSVTSSKPVLEEKVRKLKQTKTFKSKSSNGDLYAGRSKRQYYFSSEKAAINDATKSAATWLKSQSAVICKP